MELKGGLNSYRYTLNPVDYIDPLGLDNEPAVTAANADKAEEAPIDDNLPAMQEVTTAKPDYYVGPAGADATLPAIAYRYERYLNDDGTEYHRGNDMLQNKEAGVTYFGFEKHETGEEAGDAFQVKRKKHLNPLDPEDRSWSDTRLRGEFDTLQLYDESGTPQARVPRAFGDKVGAPPEPITEAYPEYGTGGSRQLHADRATIKFDKIDILPEK